MYELSRNSIGFDHKQFNTGILVTAAGGQLQVSVGKGNAVNIDELFIYLVDLVSAYADSESPVYVTSAEGKLQVKMTRSKRRLIRKLFRSVIERVASL